jgi:hypothetical protein
VGSADADEEEGEVDVEVGMTTDTDGSGEATRHDGGVGHASTEPPSEAVGVAQADAAGTAVPHTPRMQAVGAG